MPTYTTSNIPKKFNKLLKEHRDIMLEEMNITGDQWSREAKKIVLNEGHVFKHTLRNQIDARGFVDAQEGVGVYGFVPITVPYAQAIHENRKHPGRYPPFEAIAEWVNKKLGIAKDHDSFWIITKTIQRNIARNGFKSLPAGGLKYFDRPLLANQKKWIKEINKGFGDGLKRLMRNL